MTIALGFPSVDKQAVVKTIEYMMTACLLILATALLALAKTWFGRPRPIVIVVEESPRPTRTKDPLLPSPQPAQRPRQVLQAQRAGSCRIRQHRRQTTLACNPSRAGDCGYCCALVAAGMKASAKAVKLLRGEVAKIVEQEHSRGGSLADIPVQELIKQSGMDLKQYVRATKGKQWASQAELDAMSRSLGTPLDVKMGKRVLHLGKGTANYCIVYKNKHFLLYAYKRLRGKAPRKSTMAPIRGGMRPIPPWRRQMQPDLTRITVISQPPQQEPVTYSQPITIEAHDMPTNFRIAHFDMTYPPTTPQVRRHVAALYGVRSNSISLWRNGYHEIADWEQLPEYLTATYRHDHLQGDVEMTFDDQASNITFSIYIPNNQTHVQLLDTISALLRTPRDQLILDNPQGRPWIWPRDINITEPEILHLRGGMRRQASSRSRSQRRSVSPTEPFEQMQVQLDQAAPAQEGEPQAAQRDDSPTLRRQRAVAFDAAPTRYGNVPFIRRHRSASLEQRVGTSAMDMAWNPRQMEQHGSYQPVTVGEVRRLAEVPGSNVMFSNVWPRTPPPAQPNTSPRGIYCSDIQLGQLRASDQADPEEVLADFGRTIHCHAAMMFVPRSATRWEEVREVRIARPTQIQVSLPLDLRFSRWEYFEEPRIVPVLAQNHILNNVIFPEALDPVRAQQRLARAANLDEYWQLQILNGDCWVICRFFLPEAVRDSLEELDQLRERVWSSDILRGGARNKRKTLEAESGASVFAVGS